MRLYATFDEVVSEIERDLKELAIVYRSGSVQDIDTRGYEGYNTHELMNYGYTISPAIVPDYQDWDEYTYIEEEFQERVDGLPHNPGLAWYQDEEYWKEFLDSDGEFDYTYSERMYQWLSFITDMLENDPNTRRAWLAIWNRTDLVNSRQGSNYGRVPCSLGYQFMLREGRLHLHYVMRSCDFIKHFKKDVVLALKLQEYVVNHINEHMGMQLVSMGTFTHTIFSLHAFEKDLEGVF